MFHNIYLMVLHLSVALKSHFKNSCFFALIFSTFVDFYQVLAQQHNMYRGAVTAVFLLHLFVLQTAKADEESWGGGGRHYILFII